MANKTLTAKIKLDASQFEKTIKRMEDRIKSLNKAVNIISSNSFEKKFEKAAAKAKKVTQEVDKTTTGVIHLGSGMELVVRKTTALVPVLQKCNSLVAQQGSAWDVNVDKMKAFWQAYSAYARQMAARTLGAGTSEITPSTGGVTQPIAQDAEVIDIEFTEIVEDMNRMLPPAQKLASSVQQTAARTSNWQHVLSSSESKVKNIAEKLLRWMNPINHVKRAINLTKKGLAGVKKASEGVKTVLTPIINKIKDALNLSKRWGDAMKEINGILNDTDNKFGGTTSFLKGTLSILRDILTTVGAIIGAGALINQADSYIKAQNQLNNLNGGDVNATDEQMDKMYAAAQRARTNYSELRAGVAKSMTLAPEAFQDNLDNAIKFEELMAKSFALAGASQSEMANSMYQLRQGLAAGKLQGDEMKSVMENAPLAYTKIEEYVQGLLAAQEAEQGLEAGALGSTTALNKLGAEGIVTGEMIVAGIFNAEKELENAFANSAMTFEQAGASIRNVYDKAFEPVSEKLKTILNSEAGQAMLAAIQSVIVKIANAVLIVLTIVEAIINFVHQNSAWLVPILKALALIIGIVLVLALFTMAKAWLTTHAAAIKAGWAMFMATLKVVWPLLLIILIIGVVIGILNLLGVSFRDVCGYIVGAILWAVSVIWNTIVGVINAIIQFLWTYFVEPWIGIVEWVMNVFNGGFDSFGDGVKNLLGNIISWFLSLGKVVTKIIDAIFGTNWTAGLTSLQDNVLGWGKNEDAKTISREAPTLQSMTGGKVDRWASKDAFATGQNWGTTAYDWTANKLNSIGDSLNLTTGLPDPNADEYALGTGEYDPEIADNTEKMADSMELTEDDLEYLKDIANMEWKKEYTTASVTIDMTNNNNIQNANDWDGWVKHLSKTLVEELDAQANGTYTYGYTYGKGV